jgi:hypothetical protein
MSILFDLFSPGHRHRADEKDRLEHTRHVEGVSEPGRGPIDLSSGVVLIKPSASPSDALDEEAEGKAEDGGTGEA